MAAPIFVISGVPGAGKTTVARALAAKFPAVVLLVGDDLRDMVVSGFASAVDGWSSAHQLQFNLSYRAEAEMAARYADAGFIVIIDDVLREDDLVREFIPTLEDRRVRRVLLRPTLAVAIARNRARTNKSFDTERLVPIIKRLYASRFAADGWLVLDNTELPVDETVERILTGFDPLGRAR